MTVVLINTSKTSNILTQIVFDKTPELHGADEQATFVHYKPVNAIWNQIRSAGQQERFIIDCCLANDRQIRTS